MTPTSRIQKIETLLDEALRSLETITGNASCDARASLRTAIDGLSRGELRYKVALRSAAKIYNNHWNRINAADRADFLSARKS